MGKYSSAATLAVRILGLGWLVAGLWMLAANVAESASEYDPTFTGYYLHSQALRPALAIGLGIGLLFFARLFGRLLARGLDPKHDA